MVVRRVELLRRADRQPLLLGERAEVVGHRRERVEVEPAREPSASRSRSVVSAAGFDVPRASGATAVCSTPKPGAEALHVDERREADRAVAVQLDRPVARARRKWGASSRTASGVNSPPGSLR